MVSVGRLVARSVVVLADRSTGPRSPAFPPRARDTFVRAVGSAAPNE